MSQLKVYGGAPLLIFNMADPSSVLLHDAFETEIEDIKLHPVVVLKLCIGFAHPPVPLHFTVHS